jgi:hypothetical protein
MMVLRLAVFAVNILFCVVEIELADWSVPTSTAQLLSTVDVDVKRKVFPLVSRSIATRFGAKSKQKKKEFRH